MQRQFNKWHCINADRTETMFDLIILEKIKETRLKFSQGSLTVL